MALPLPAHHEGTSRVVYGLAHLSFVERGTTARDGQNVYYTKYDHHHHHPQTTSVLTLYGMAYR